MHLSETKDSSQLSAWYFVLKDLQKPPGLQLYFKMNPPKKVRSNQMWDSVESRGGGGYPVHHEHAIFILSWSAFILFPQFHLANSSTKKAQSQLC